VPGDFNVSGTLTAAGFTGFTSTGIDDNATSNAITIDANENVGINETSPAANLHLGASSPHIDIGPSGANRGKIGFNSNNVYIGSTSGAGEIHFKNNISSNDAPNSSGDTKMIIADSAVIIGNGVTLGNGTTYAAANTLDDYEEGTWTPTWQGASGQSGQSYSTREASYTKIGRAVNIQCYMNISDRGNFTNGAKVAGLPFTVSPSNQAAVTFGYHSGFNLNSGNSLQGWVYSGDFFYLYQGNGSTDSIALVQSATDSGPTFHFSFTYFTSD
jgi:hypothetical protein